MTRNNRYNKYKTYKKCSCCKEHKWDCLYEFGPEPKNENGTSDTCKKCEKKEAAGVDTKFTPHNRTTKRKHTQRNNGPTNVYCVECVGRYKIGSSKDVEGRIEVISTHCPYEPKLICCWPESVKYGTEIDLHHKFRKKRVKGEWFELTARDVAWLKRTSIIANNRTKGRRDVEANSGRSTTAVALS